MKLFLTFSVVFSVATVLLSCQALKSETIPTNNQSFEQWCQQKNSLPTETRTTVEVLLKKVNTQDCKLADSKLNSLSEIYLDDISDVKPLTGLTKLTKLSLKSSRISDIQPLASLTNLTKLYLSENQISEKVCPVKSESVCIF
jgi:internalin A